MEVSHFPLQTRLDENLPSSQSYILTLADAAHITPHIYTIGSILRTVVCQADLTEYVSLKKKSLEIIFKELLFCVGQSQVLIII